ncbi:hypothetical protein A2949_03100 [Candidatus Adlerbacteria bacterium RIFCSPLOWO2_01_FULL_54_21b]|uniref:Uncharacterized protein n=1 Tax=Candidatus Adlerbacteria bacterium RIFCSPLOWO2_01_FULL_54_21b TaxID=1797245 RepID=A0A1F4XXR0_9BACT|nr:MAG: hypothetical protein A2949_03100 [Candidatus Adlerbacteria bacterium RIFCSPLOWO2_01_FULL_54_21b]
MADEPESGGPYEIILFVGGILLVLVLLWYQNGGPDKADLRGLFLAPPMPVGSGDAYGPQLSATTTIDTRVNKQ